MISVESVNKWFGDHQVLHDCTLAIASGEVVVICGPSGSGKSTLIKCINGLEPVQSGSIHVNGEPVIQSSAALLRLRRKVSMVFQSFELYPHMKVIDNLTLAPVVALRRNKTEATEKAKALLAQVGMAALQSAGRRAFRADSSSAWRSRGRWRRSRSRSCSTNPHPRSIPR